MQGTTLKSTSPVAKRRKQDNGATRMENEGEATISKVLRGMNSVESRVLVFDGLRDDEKIKVLCPPNDLPRLPEKSEYPERWDVAIWMASKMVTEKIEVMATKMAAEELEKEKEEEEEYDNEDEDEPGHDHDLERGGYVFPQDVRRKWEGGGPSVVRKQNLLKFLRMLKTCIPMFSYGFMIEEGSDEFCFCPCQKNRSHATVAGCCQELCGMETVLEDNACNNNGKFGVGPKAFLDHIRGKKSNCQYHEIMYDFLFWVFGYMPCYVDLFWKEGERIEG